MLSHLHFDLSFEINVAPLAHIYIFAPRFSGMEIKIVHTQEADVLARLNEDVQSLHTRLYPNVFKPYNKEAIEKALQEMLDLENCIAYLALNGDLPLGYMLAFIDHKPENPFTYERYDLYIDQVVVKEAFRGKGVAVKLMNEAKKFAERMGMHRIHLDHWKYNDTAQLAFEKMGFEAFKYQMELRLR